MNGYVAVGLANCTYTAFAGNESKTEGMRIEATIANVRNWKTSTSLKYGTFSAESVGKEPVPMTIKVETKSWSRVDVQVSLVIKSGNDTIFKLAGPDNTIQFRWLAAARLIPTLGVPRLIRPS
jgi:hypothetical protein